jgi:hypothetical protein
MSIQHTNRSRWPVRPNRLLLTLTASLIGSVCAPANLAVADPNPSRSQQQIQQSTRAINAQIESLLAEFERNDLAGSAAQMLRAIRASLAQLTDDQMQRVLQSLQQARLLDAYTGQKHIIVQLRQILLEYQRHQTLQDLANRFQELSVRQHNNLTETIALAQWSSNENQTVSLDLQIAEQKSLHEEVHPLLIKLTSLAPDTDSWNTHACRQAVRYAQEQQLLPVMAAATANLHDGKLSAATAGQTRARDILRQIARQLAPLDNRAALRQGIQDISVLEEQQRQLMDETQKTGFSTTAAPSLERKQARLADETSRVQQDLQQTAPTPASSLHDAARHMEQARPLLSQKEKPAALTQQRAALAQLTAAREQLQRQLSEPEPPPATPAEAIAQLKELQRQTNELTAEQTRLQQAAAGQSNRQELRKLADQEHALQQKTETIAQQTATLAMDAASTLNEAADQMDEASRALAQNDPAKGSVAQSAAQAALTKASQQLAQATAKAEQNQRARETGAALRSELADLIEAQQQTQLQTATSPSADLARRQGELSQQSQQLSQRLAPVSPPAGTAAGQAGQQMRSAQDALSRNDAAGARQAQQSAMNELFKAKDAIDDRLADLGMSSDPGDAAGKLAQAQESAAKATQQLRANDRQAAQSLRKAASEAGQLAASTPGTPGKAMQNAQQQLTTATAQAAANDFTGALNNAMAAQESLSQAQASLAMRGVPTAGKSGSSGEGNWTGGGDGTLPSAVKDGGGQFVGLPPRDREAIQQSQAEKYPAEYGPQIEQYLRNLAEEAEKRP